jgi:hypothetical protein
MFAVSIPGGHRAVRWPAARSVRLFGVPAESRRSTHSRAPARSVSAAPLQTPSPLFVVVPLGALLTRQTSGNQSASDRTGGVRLLERRPLEIGRQSFG